VTTVPRRELLAYLIGAGVAGTILVGPYVGRLMLTALVPELVPLSAVPFFLLPLFWGGWNWLRVRLRPRIDIGHWGAILGLVLAAAVNVLLAAEERWVSGVALLLVAIPAFYYLLWSLLIGPLNEAFGVETSPT
jgi:hypothetical protein